MKTLLNTENLFKAFRFIMVTLIVLSSIVVIANLDMFRNAF